MKFLIYLFLSLCILLQSGYGRQEANVSRDDAQLSPAPPGRDDAHTHRYAAYHAQHLFIKAGQPDENGKQDNSPSSARDCREEDEVSNEDDEAAAKKHGRYGIASTLYYQTITALLANYHAPGSLHRRERQSKIFSNKYIIFRTIRI